MGRLWGTVTQFEAHSPIEKQNILNRKVNYFKDWEIKNNICGFHLPFVLNKILVYIVILIPVKLNFDNIFNNIILINII